MKTSTLLLIAASVGMGVGAYAGEHSIRQKGRVFSMEQLEIKRGDVVTFVNDDNVPHNIYSTSEGNKFNMGSQPPGISTPVTFTTAGDVNVRCLIHPRMQMSVKITE